jgi:hypothetical protein
MNFWPFTPNNPEAWAMVPFDEAKLEMESRGADNIGFVGHDGVDFYFQVFGDDRPITIPMTTESKEVAR